MDEVYKAPVDGLDRFCQSHDRCYGDCRRDFPCGPAGRTGCMKDCDATLRRNYLSSMTFAFNVVQATLGYWSLGLPGPVVIEAVYRHDPSEPNDPKCRCTR